ncbi:MAG: PTS sugar transporter subunit IIA, partial [bacterium]
TVVVPVFELEPKDIRFVQRRIRLAASLCSPGEQLEIVHFNEVPDQSFLGDYEPDKSGSKNLYDRVELIRNQFQGTIVLEEVVTHHTRGALRSYIESKQPEWLVYKWVTPSPWQFLLGQEKWWMEELPCNQVFFDVHEGVGFEDIIVLTEPGPFDGEVVRAADRVAHNNNGSVLFLNPVAPTDKAKRFVNRYQRELKNLCKAPAKAEAISSSNWIDQVVELSYDKDLLLFGGLTNETFPGFSAQKRGEIITEQVDCSVIRVESQLPEARSIPRESSMTDEQIWEKLKKAPVQTGLRVADKHELFEKIGQMLSGDSTSAESIHQAITVRENVQHTYLEQGFALPHGVLNSINKIKLGTVFLDSPLAYTSEDERVEACVVIIGPEGNQKRYLELMASIARILKNHSPDELRNKLTRSIPT